MADGHTPARRRRGTRACAKLLRYLSQHDVYHDAAPTPECHVGGGGEQDDRHVRRTDSRTLGTSHPRVSEEPLHSRDAEGITGKDRAPRFCGGGLRPARCSSPEAADGRSARDPRCGRPTAVLREPERWNGRSTTPRRSPIPPAHVVLQDLATLVLDVAALEKGYRRPSARRPLAINVVAQPRRLRALLRLRS